jgi:hypothetical protein
VAVTDTKTHTATHLKQLVRSPREIEAQQHREPFPAMEKAHKAVDAVVDGVKKVAIGSDKKSKAKKEKGGDGGADTPLGRRNLGACIHHANKIDLQK